MPIAQAAQRLAQSDLSVDVTPLSDDDVLGVAFQEMVRNLRDLVGQVQTSAISMADTSASGRQHPVRIWGGCDQERLPAW